MKKGGGSPWLPSHLQMLHHNPLARSRKDKVRRAWHLLCVDGLMHVGRRRVVGWLGFTNIPLLAE